MTTGEVKQQKVVKILKKVALWILVALVGLVAQDPDDESASVLLERIQGEQTKISGKKKRGRQLELPGICSRVQGVRQK